MWFMKQLKLLIFLLTIGFVADAQINYLNYPARYRWYAGKFDSTITIPYGLTPSIRTGGFTGPASLFYKTSDSTVYVYTGTQWISVKGTGSSGSADSSIFLIDTTYTRLAQALGTDTLLLKSFRYLFNGVEITPTVTDSTVTVPIVAATTGEIADSLEVIRQRYDRAFDTIIYVNDTTVIWQRYDGTSDTLQFHPGSRDRFGFAGEDVSATDDRLFNSTHSFRMFLDSFIVHGSVLRLDTIDFHIKGDSLQDLFYVNTNINKIGIGTKNPYNLIGNTTTQITDGSNGVSGDGVGFRLSVGGYMAAFENESTGTGRGILVKSGGDFGILNVQNESNVSVLRADKDSVITEIAISDADSTRQLATTKWVKKRLASISGGGNPYPTSFAKNAGRDSIILTLSDGTRFAAKDSTGGASGLTVGTTTIASSNSRGILYDSSGILKNRGDFAVFTTGEVGVGYTTAQGYKLSVNGSILSTSAITTGTGTFISGLFTSGGFSTSHSNSDNADLYVRGGTTASTTTQSEILIGGASTVGNRASFRGSANYTMTANHSYGGVILGKELQTEASSGTHALYAKLAIRQDSVINGTATTTHATSLYIQGPPTTNGSFGTSTSAYIQTGDVLLGSGILTATGGLKTGDPGSGAGTWKLGTIQSSTGLTIDPGAYIEVSIGGVTYWLALAAPPIPKPQP